MSSNSIHKRYQEAVKLFADKKSNYKKDIKSAPNSVQISTYKEGITLNLCIDSESHIVIDAKYAYTGDDYNIDGIMSAFCEILTGKPLLEGSDHGVIYLEEMLADDSIAPSIQGLMIQEVAEPAFALPLFLIRAAMDTYRQQTGYEETLNEYLSSIPIEWKELTSDQKLDKLEKVTREKFEFGGVDINGIYFESVEHQIRITVRFDEAIDKKLQPSLIMKLEKCLKEHTGVKIDLVYVGMADANYKRRNSGANK